MNIVFLGLPGAGKGTHSKKAAKEFDITHISTGDIFRNAIKNETPLGQKAKQFIDAGELVPDEITIKLVRQTIEDLGEDEDLIFDGFPRTIEQAKAFTEMLEEIGERIDLCIYIEVKEENLIYRISGRRICNECGEIFHFEFNPPKHEGTCDKCGGSLYQREDDKEEIVRKRIRSNKEKTLKLVEYYQDKGVLETVVGTDKLPEQVFKEIKKIIGEYI